ncbi:hypothetical protein MMC25_002985 [Agyrium rufum]|nr:hypothetical protein [Agyrium rufum]
MRQPFVTPQEVISLLFFPLFTSAISCDHIRVDGTKFNLDPLAGPHSVLASTAHYPRVINSNFTIDLCQPLKPKEMGENRCKVGTYVCGVQTEGDDKRVEGIIPIAGQYTGGSDMDVQYTRLKTSKSVKNGDLEGVTILMSGAKYDGRPQEAQIEMHCWTGDKDTERMGRRKEGGDDEENGGDEKEKPLPEPEWAEDGKGGRLRYISYGPLESNGAKDLLLVQWQTKYACENREEDPNEKPKGWGFFTWIFVIAFLAVASYLIFGSWLNYNRYGARGWDLLPHGDTIRDVPYILQDWGRKVADTVQGGGARGGYSAV